MKKLFVSKVFAATILSAVLLTGCGSSGQASSSKNSDSYMADSAAPGDYAYEESAMAEGGSYNSDSDTEYDDNGEDSTGEIVLSEEKIVYTANISMSTKSFDSSVSAAKALAKKYKAIVQSESYSDSDTSWYRRGYERRSGGSRRYDVSLRVPQKNYEPFVNSTGDIEGVIDSKDSTADNISQDYYDMKEVIASYEEELARLKELMGQATEMSDIIVLEDKIREVTGTLNQRRSTLRRMDTDVAYSYVNLTINEVAVYEKEQIKEETFVERIAGAFTEAIEEFIIFISELAIVIVRHWLLLLFIAIIVILIIRRNRRKKFGKKERKPLFGKKRKNGESEFVSDASADRTNDQNK